MLKLDPYDLISIVEIDNLVTKESFNLEIDL